MKHNACTWNLPNAFWFLFHYLSLYVSFSTIALTKYNKIDVVKQHKFTGFSSVSWKSNRALWAKIKVSCILSCRLWVWSVSLTFIYFRGHLHSLACFPLFSSSIFKVSKASWVFLTSHHFASNTVTSCPLSLSCLLLHLRILKIIVSPLGQASLGGHYSAYCLPYFVFVRVHCTCTVLLRHSSLECLVLHEFSLYTKAFFIFNKDG